MSIEVTDYVDVGKRMAELGCVMPRSVALLPENFSTAPSRGELLHRSEAATVRTLFRNSEVPVDDILPAGERIPYIQNNAFEWIAPTIFFAAAFLAQNDATVSIALNVLSNYITDFFKGIPGHKAVKFKIVVERKAAGPCTEITYEGSPDGLAALADVVREASK
jgi:hypothetical protein